jgi:mono/diheme cytochrome c family protein
MSRLARPALLTIAVAAFAAALWTRSTAPLLGQASAPSPTQAAPFVGDWLVSLAMGANESTFAVSVKADGGKVTATVAADGQPTVNVTDISMTGNSFVLRYVTEAMNTQLPTAITLTPDGSGMRAGMALLDGQYEMSGTAARQAPGTAARATGFGRGGQGQESVSNNATDFSPKPPYRARTPAEEAAGFILPTGYRMELVAADPDVISPAVIEFDGNGRMYVVELISYMMDASASREHEPISRISRWESTKGDGRYDKHTVFVDHVVAPRMVLPLQNGVILTSETDSDDLVKWSDTNGDGVADTREVVFTGIGQSGDANIEHQKAGLLWNMDNWIYTTYNAFRIRWTPSGFLREPTAPNGGQWGMASDDDGKPWFVDAGGERGPMNFQYPIHYGGFSPCPPAGRGRAGAPPAAPNPNCPPGMENGFEKDFAVVWPAPGIGDMQGGIGRTRMPAQNLNHFTATTGPAIVRGDALPADMKGDLLFAEPVGRLIRRAKIDNIEGLTQLRNAYPGSELLTSVDQLFRPVNISNAPDGTVYIADMYHGIIQEREWSGPGTYLRAKIEQYQLDSVVSHGRIWRLRYDGRSAVPATATNPGQPAIAPIALKTTPPRMFSETPAQLVAHFTHPNGWWRDTAQRLLILEQDKSVVPALQQMARSSDNLLARFHALWTLEGLGALDAGLVREGMKDASPRMRVQAIRASETLYKAGDRSLAADYRAMTKDPDPNVTIQAMVTMNLFKLPDAAEAIKATQAATKARGVALVAERLLVPATNFGGRRGGMTPDQEKRLQQGSDVFSAVCFACHGTDGMGKAMEGAAAGAMLGPALAGSPRVQAHRDYVIKVLLHGLTGPLDGKVYPDVMAPLGSTSTDEWVAGVASYVRSSFGNTGGPVTPEDVARVRKATASRKTPWTLAELDASLPRAIDAQGWKLTASHGAETAAAATSLRGWSSDVPQAAKMWFGVELASPANVTELQFDSNATSGRGAGAGRGGAPGAPAVGYPRGYTVQLSLDGTAWSAPVATGKGEGAHTTIAFAPARAKFIRITQTDAAADAPAWSIKNLRVYEVSGPS